MPFATRWLFDVELIARHAIPGPLSECVHEIPVRHWEGVPGSRLGVRELVRIPLELMRIARLQRRRSGKAGAGR